jgi:NAD(P)-dependent dehydrogenase (short-subunit alcohol dehydrogenase family)
LRNIYILTREEKSWNLFIKFIEKFLKMTGTVLITGANGTLALGFVEAFLAQYPQHTLVATVRNTSPEKDPNTAKLMQLIAKHPGADVHVEALDLGNLAGVRSYADKLAARVSCKKLPRIVAIVCNAATWSLGNGQRFTSDGYEASFQVNHLSHYLLVLKLLGSMNMTSGRIVMLGSIVHYPEKRSPLSSLAAHIPDNMEELLKPGPDPAGLVHDRGWQRYGSSKLANVIFAEDLNSRLQQV